MNVYSLYKYFETILINNNDSSNLDSLLLLVNEMYFYQLFKVLYKDYDNNTVQLEYVDFIKAIPSGPVAEEIKREYKLQKNTLQNTYNMRINISPKVDSGKQRRVQCSIPKVNELLEQFPEIIISKTVEPVVRNVPIIKQIQSAARVRNKK